MRSVHRSIIRLPPLLVAVSVLVILYSCNDDLPPEECPCPKGGMIGGWEDPDTTDVNKEPNGGFDVSLDNWNDTIHNNIVL